MLFRALIEKGYLVINSNKNSLWCEFENLNKIEQ